MIQNPSFQPVKAHQQMSVLFLEMALTHKELHIFSVCVKILILIS